MPEYDCSISITDTVTIRAKDRHKALEEAKEIFEVKFFNELDCLQVVER